MESQAENLQSGQSIDNFAIASSCSLIFDKVEDSLIFDTIVTIIITKKFRSRYGNRNDSNARCNNWCTGFYSHNVGKDTQRNRPTPK